MPPIEIVILFIIGSLILWRLIFVFLARASGWKTMAQYYAAPHIPTGKAFNWVSAKIRWVGYNNCLKAIISKEGLYLKPNVLFTMSHPALLIPWHKISAKDTVKFLGFKFTNIQIETDEGAIKARLPGHVTDAMENTLREQL